MLSIGALSHLTVFPYKNAYMKLNLPRDCLHDLAVDVSARKETDLVNELPVSLVCPKVFRTDSSVDCSSLL